jgi:hypothetical protein
MTRLTRPRRGAVSGPIGLPRSSKLRGPEMPNRMRQQQQRRPDTDGRAVYCGPDYRESLRLDLIDQVEQALTADQPGNPARRQDLGGQDRQKFIGDHGMHIAPPSQLSPTVTGGVIFRCISCVWVRPPSRG